MPTNWSDWLSISKSIKYYRPAVYQVRWARSGEPIPISRFARVDLDGILCIGKTKNMDQRRRNFGNGMRRGEGHSEADILFYLKHFGASLTVPDESQLQFSYKSFDGERAALRYEELLILAYMRRFGEVPPLNSAIPGKKNPGAWEAAKVLMDEGAI